MALKQLKLVQFNLENFFIYLDHYEQQDLSNLKEKTWQSLSSSTEKNKELHKLWAIKGIIDDIQPDVMFLNEVGGAESLQNFCQYFLEDQYEPYLIEGNSHRGIDVGYLVKKELGLKILHLSHKNRPINFLYPNEEGGDKKSHYFSRDVSELRLFNKEQPNTPMMVFLCVHLKSKLDPDGVDFQGRKRREAELKTLINIYNEVSTELNHEVPIVLGGDFNGIASPMKTEDEFKYLYENSLLTELLEHLEVPLNERFTQIIFNPSGKASELQLDYFFLNSKFKDLVIKDHSGIYRFKSELGVELPIPQNIEQRNLLPSDHYPVYLTLKL